MVIFHSYVKLPEGIRCQKNGVESCDVRADVASLRMALVESHQKYRHHQTAKKQKQNMPSQ